MLQNRKTWKTYIAHAVSLLADDTKFKGFKDCFVFSYKNLKENIRKTKSCMKINYKLKILKVM